MLTLLILLLSVSVILCDHSECLEREMGKCDPNLIPQDFPDTAEKFRSSCNNFETVGRCMILAHETCGYSIMINDMRSIIEFVISICNEDSPIYKVISSNIDCIAPVARNFKESCNRYKFNNDSLAVIHERGISSNYRRGDMRECLPPFWEVSCQSITMGLHCGSEVKEAAEKVFPKIHGRYKQCRSEIIEQLKPLYETYYSVIEEEQRYRNELRK